MPQPKLTLLAALHFPFKTMPAIHSKAHLYNRAGWVLARYGYHNAALPYFTKAFKLATNYQLQILQAQCLNNWSTALLAQEKLDEAMDKCMQSLQLAKQLRKPVEEATAFLTLGRIYTQLKDYNKAFTYLNYNLSLWRKLRNKNKMGEAILYIGNALLHHHQLEPALPQLASSLRLAQQSRNHFVQAQALFSMAQMYHLQGEFNVALSHYKRSLSLAELYGYLQVQQQNYLGLAKWHKEQTPPDLGQAQFYEAQVLRVNKLLNTSFNYA